MHSPALYCYSASRARRPARGSKSDPGADPRTLRGCFGHTSTPARLRRIRRFYPSAPFQILPRSLQGHSRAAGICRRADADIRHLPYHPEERKAYLVVKKTRQSDQEDLKDAGLEEADLVLKKFKLNHRNINTAKILTSWCKHLKPGIDFAKVHTCRTWSMNFSENCSRKKASGRPFMGHETTV